MSARHPIEHTSARAGRNVDTQGRHGAGGRTMGAGSRRPKPTPAERTERKGVRLAPRLPGPTVSAPKATKFEPRGRYEHHGGVRVPCDQWR